MEFYDIWVARDSDGNLFEKHAPYVTDPYSLDRVARGLPFPVKCCWNGMVILSSGPFLRHGTRVRPVPAPHSNCICRRNPNCMTPPALWTRSLGAGPHMQICILTFMHLNQT